ncbi:MAG: DUF488 family protein [bacterium]
MRVPSGDQSTAEFLTIGHSNRSNDEFLRILKENRVSLLLDVRTYPNSRRFPHFSEGNLRKNLTDIGIEYRHCKHLGGRRDPADQTQNSALEEGFRAVADHLNTDVGQRVLGQLETLASDRSERELITLMCAERDYRRCHRKLISDHLLVRDFDVVHLIDESRSEPHELHPYAREKNGKVTYSGLV